MKKLLVLMLSLVLCLSLVACGNTDDVNNDNDNIEVPPVNDNLEDDVMPELSGDFEEVSGEVSGEASGEVPEEVSGEVSGEVVSGEIAD